jgi:hypothetical protein
MLGGWFGLLALGALRSPFAPPEALIPVVWALSFRAAAAEYRNEVVFAGALWLMIMITIPVPTPAAAAVSLGVQMVVYGTSLWLALGKRLRAAPDALPIVAKPAPPMIGG